MLILTIVIKNSYSDVNRIGDITSSGIDAIISELLTVNEFIEMDDYVYCYCLISAGHSMIKADESSPT